VKTTIATTPPEPLERLGDELRRAAYARAARLDRRRRRIRVAAAAVLAAALMTGIGLAASGVDVLAPFRSDEPGTAQYRVDRNAVYHGLAPSRLGCASVRGATFTCAVRVGSARRVYTLLTRVERPERSAFSRNFLLRAVERAERRGDLTALEARRFRRDIAAVGDDFFRALNRLTGVQTIGVGVGTSARGEIVPPRGVPMLIFCDSVSAGQANCHSLAGAGAVPARAPIYELRPSADWVPAPPHPAGMFGAVVFDAVLARPLRPEEIRLLTDLATVGEAHSGSSGARRAYGSSSAYGGGAASGSGSSSGGFSSSDR
jgi:uncharacterized membrane protein YgcG